ncbi:MAG: hypothetical protein QW540_11100 [Archaeoglobaceae archaeon]
MKAILFALFLVFLAFEVVAQPELEAYSTTSHLSAGKMNELKVVLVNLAKPEEIGFGTIEKELFYNASLTAYNLEIRLESRDAEVKLGKIYIPALPPAKSVDLSFPVSIPQNASEKISFTLYVDYERLCNILNESGNYRYEYCSEFETFEFQLDVIESFKPEFRVSALTSKLYEGQVNRITLMITNSGVGEARDLEIRLLGFESVTPQVFYLPVLRPLNSSMITFEAIAKAENFTLAISYLYYDNGWNRGYEEIAIPMKLEKMSKGLEFALSKSKFERDESGILELAVMNNNAFPISGLKLKIEADSFEFDATEFLLGYLNSGEVRRIALKYKVSESASFGFKELRITADYKIVASELLASSETKTIPLLIEENPFFEVHRKAIIYHGENVLRLEITNSGGIAKNVHFKLNPSPGIRLKTPEAYLERIESNSVSSVVFRVYVDEDVIPNNDYRIELSYKADNYEGKEVSGSFYAYVTVLEKSWLEKYYAYLVFAMLLALIIAVRVKKMR